MQTEAADRLRASRLGNQYVTLAALITTMVVNQTGVVIISPLVVDIADTFGISTGVAAQVRTAAALSSAILAPWIGVISERIGRKPLILLGMGIVGSTALGSAIAPSFTVLLVIQALNGVGIAALLSMAFAAVGDYFPAERRSWAVGLVTIGQPLAWVIGLPLIGLLADGFGWRWSFVGVPFLFSLVGFWFATKLPRVQGARSERQQYPALRSLSGVLRDRSATAWVVTELCSVTGWAGILIFLGAFYISQFELTAGKASPLLSLSALAFVIGSLLAHRLSRRLGLRRVILLSAIASAILIAYVLAYPPQLATAVLILMLFGLSQGVRGATASSLGLQQVPQYIGTMMALRASVVQLAYVFGGIIGWALLDHSGYGSLGLVFAVLIGIGGVLTQLLVLEQPQHQLGATVGNKPRGSAVD